MSLIVEPTVEAQLRPNDSIFGEKGSVLQNSTRKSKLQEAVLLENNASFKGIQLCAEDDSSDEESKQVEENNRTMENIIAKSGVFRSKEHLTQVDDTNDAGDAVFFNIARSPASIFT